MEQLLVVLNKRSYQLEVQFSPSVQLNILVYSARRYPRTARNDISALPVINCPRYCAFILALSTSSTLLVPKQTPLQLLLLLIWRHVNTIGISRTFSCHKPYFGNLVLMVTETCLSLQKTQSQIWVSGVSCLCLYKIPLSPWSRRADHTHIHTTTIGKCILATFNYWFPDFWLFHFMKGFHVAFVLVLT